MMFIKGYLPAAAVPPLCDMSLRCGTMQPATECGRKSQTLRREAPGCRLRTAAGIRHVIRSAASARVFLEDDACVVTAEAECV